MSVVLKDGKNISDELFEDKDASISLPSDNSLTLINSMETITNKIEFNIKSNNAYKVLAEYLQEGDFNYYVGFISLGNSIELIKLKGQI